MIVELVIAAALALLSWGAWSYRFGWSSSPDGWYYARASAGELVPLPFSLRWLLPVVLGSSRLRWHVTTAAALVALGPLVWLRTRSMEAVWLLVWLPGIFEQLSRHPRLVDAPAWALALAAALVWPSCWWAGLLLALAAGATRETAAVFAAVWAGEPLLALGVIGALVGPSSSPPDSEELEAPWAFARSRHPNFLDAAIMLGPWGALAPLAAIGALEASPRELVIAGVALVLAYGQLLRAGDTARLFSWAAPALLPLALRAPWPVLELGLAVHPFVCALYLGRKHA